MIEFELPESIRNIQNAVHQLAQNVFRPAARQGDREHGFSREFIKKLMKMGVSGGLATRMDTTGGPDDAAEVKDKTAPKKSQRNRIGVVLAEEMAWGDTGLILSLPGPGLGGPPVQLTGTKEQKERFLGMLQGEEPKYGAYALTEPGAGSDVARISTTARKDGDCYVINGTKCFITNGAKAAWNVVFATIDKTQGRAGHRAFVVTNDTPGFSVGKIEEKMGLRASETAELVYEDCRVPKDCLLGGEEHYERIGKGGFKTAMATFDATRPLVAAMGLGIARAAFEFSRDWARQNYDFSRPISRIRQKLELLASMERRLEAARMLCWRAAWMADEGIPNTKEASMAKAYSGTIATQVCYDAIQVMGPEGLSEDHLVEKWFRDIKVFDIFEGTGQVQRVVISKRLIPGIEQF